MLTNPSHPGELIRDEILPAYGLSKTAAAVALAITRANLHRVLEGQAALSPELALKIEKAFGTSAQLLMAMQANHDLAAARRDFDTVTAGVERQTMVSRPA